jgi:hypothetical protein
MPRLDGIIQLNRGIQPPSILVKIASYMYGHGSTRIPPVKPENAGSEAESWSSEGVRL